jgi:hypothetical protein
VPHFRGALLSMRIHKLIFVLLYLFIWKPAIAKQETASEVADRYIAIFDKLNAPKPKIPFNESVISKTKCSLTKINKDVLELINSIEYLKKENNGSVRIKISNTYLGEFNKDFTIGQKELFLRKNKEGLHSGKYFGVKISKDNKFLDARYIFPVSVDGNWACVESSVKLELKNL